MNHFICFTDMISIIFILALFFPFFIKDDSYILVLYAFLSEVIIKLSLGSKKNNVNGTFFYYKIEIYIN